MTQLSTPSQAYLVCATPRSGSTLLCEMLRETGRAGAPLEHFEILRHSSLPRQPREYFEDVGSARARAAARRWRPGTPERRDGGRVVGTDPGRGTQRQRRLGRQADVGPRRGLRRARARAARARPTPICDVVLRELLGDPALVFVTRRDKAAQAVSLWRAVQTQSWRAGEAPSADSVVYEFEAIDHLVSQLEADERSWSDWFARTRRKPIHVTYERLDAAPSHTVEVVLARAWTSRQRAWRCRGSRVSATSCRRPGSSATAQERGESRVSATARRVSQLRALEAEAVFVIREVVAELARPGAAVQRRQGLDRAAARRREGVPPAAAAVPGAARRHRPQLPRGDRVPRPAPARGRPSADRGLGPGLDRHRPRQGGRAAAARATGCRR